MCKFFSLVSDGKGCAIYFDWTLRQKCIKGELDYNPDSHTSIADHFGYKGKKEDKLNKYEYNPLTKEFAVDQLNTKDDSATIKAFCEALDFKTIVPQLIIKPIIHPFELFDGNPQTPADQDILDTKQWDSVWASVRASVGASVWDSVGASVWDSVGASVGASVWDSVGAYTSSFFDIEYKYDFASAIRLWERGFVPSYDGKTWRLHSGKKAKVVYTATWPK